MKNTLASSAMIITAFVAFSCQPAHAQDQTKYEYEYNVSPNLNYDENRMPQTGYEKSVGVQKIKPGFAGQEQVYFLAVTPMVREFQNGPYVPYMHETGLKTSNGGNRPIAFGTPDECIRYVRSNVMQELVEMSNPDLQHKAGCYRKDDEFFEIVKLTRRRINANR